MTPLEERYRRLARLLPRYYRDDWEDDMVATFVDSTVDTSDDPEYDLDYGRPDVREIASVLAAVRLRLSSDGPRRYAAAGTVTRYLALAGVCFQASLALITGVLRLTWPPPLVRDAPTPALVFALLWLPALGFLLGERRGYALVFAALATVGTELQLPGNADLLILQLATLLFVAVHPRPATVHTRLWLVACPATAIVAFLTQLPGLTGNANVAAAITVLAGLALLGPAPTAARAAWLTAAAVVVIAELTAQPTLPPEFVPVSFVLIAALVVVGAALALRIGLHRSRRRRANAVG
ncbi:hypothetical protein [Amycolatopsis sp. NPDC051903]|uniref:hypothetical protein n=1 Tax=Amycolatopsis sp. NPDC051903 TaxID=3363936 RepID=UPI00378B9CA4